MRRKIDNPKITKEGEIVLCRVTIRRTMQFGRLYHINDQFDLYMIELDDGSIVNRTRERIKSFDEMNKKQKALYHKYLLLGVNP